MVLLQPLFFCGVECRDVAIVGRNRQYFKRWCLFSFFISDNFIIFARMLLRMARHVRV